MPADLQSLRQQLQEQFPQAHQHPSPPPPTEVSSQLPAFPSGALSELTPAGPASGLSLILAELLQEPNDPNSPPTSDLRLPRCSAAKTGPPTIVLVDGSDSFDPASYGPESCSRLLWVRCHHAAESLRCTDLLLRDGNLPLLVLDLQLTPLAELRKIPTSSWYRLRNLAKQSGAALLIFTPKHLVPCATLQLTLESHFSLQDLEELQSSIQCAETRHQSAVNDF